MLPVANHHSPARFSIVTLSLIIANIYVFWQEIIALDTREFIMTWALIPSLLDINKPETLATFITFQFLHASVAHIFFNMWFLYIFGRNIEARFGSIRFLFFYLASGVFAALTQIFLIANPDSPMLGASGAVAGVLGAYWVLFYNHRIDIIIPPIFIPIRMRASIVLFFWFASQLLSGVSVLVQDTVALGVAFWAHIGGFIFGMAVAVLSGTQKNNSLDLRRDLGD